MRAAFTILDVDAERVTIRDEANIEETMTVTNDAEAVVEHLLLRYPGRRIFYYDTDGHLDELAHDGVRFTKFQPGPGRSSGKVRP